MATNKFFEYKNQQWIILSKRGRLSPLPNVYSMEAVDGEILEKVKEEIKKYIKKD